MGSATSRLPSAPPSKHGSHPGPAGINAFGQPPRKPVPECYPRGTAGMPTAPERREGARLFACRRTPVRPWSSRPPRERVTKGATSSIPSRWGSTWQMCDAPVWAGHSPAALSSGLKPSRLAVARSSRFWSSTISLEVGPVEARIRYGTGKALSRRVAPASEGPSPIRCELEGGRTRDSWKGRVSRGPRRNYPGPERLCAEPAA